MQSIDKRPEHCADRGVFSWYGYRVARVMCALVCLPAGGAWAACAAGDLDPRYCDANGDLVADAPTDSKLWRDPSSLFLSYSPQEDTGSYEKLWAHYVKHMGDCTARPVRFFQVQTSAAAVEAFRSGRLQFSMLATGDTPFAVNIAGAQPYAGIGSVTGLLKYHVLAIVRKDSAYRALTDLKGKRVAHTAASSNSGNLVPRALFPAAGLTPDQDYKVIYSGKHDNSVLGVLRGDYDAGVVADDVLDRMVARGVVKQDQFRVIFKSDPFPSGSMVVAYDLHPNLREKIRSCTLSYRFTPELKAAFHGADRYVTMDYKHDFAAVRAVAKAAGIQKTSSKEQVK